MEHILAKPSVCFEVEKIIAFSKGDGDVETYCVQWAPCWVTGAQLSGCEHLIKEFLSNSSASDTESYQEIVERPSMAVTDNCLEDDERDEVPNVYPLCDGNSIKIEEDKTDVDDTQTEFRDVVSLEDISSQDAEIARIESYAESTDVYEGLYLETGNVETVIVEPQEPKINKKSLNTLKCRSCEEYFNSKRQLNGHMQKVHVSGIKKEPGKVLENKDTKIKSITNEPHKTGNKKKQPVRNENMFHCNICKKSYVKKTNLDNHFCLSLCPFCKKEFTDPSGLKRHVRTHTNERPYVCSVCPMAFKVSATLKRHSMVHTGEKRYVCTTCDKAFSLYENMRRHEKLHVKSSA